MDMTPVFIVLFFGLVCIGILWSAMYWPIRRTQSITSDPAISGRDFSKDFSVVVLLKVALARFDTGDPLDLYIALGCLRVAKKMAEEQGFGGNSSIQKSIDLVSLKLKVTDCSKLLPANCA